MRPAVVAGYGSRTLTSHQLRHLTRGLSVVTEATKKFREIFAYALLGVAALYLISGLSLLFKSEEDFGVAFAERAAAVGYVFAHPVLVLSLVIAVALVVGFGQASKNAKIVVLVALGIGAISFLFALISWFTAFGADSGLGGDFFGGVFGAGKIVGIFLGLAQLVFLGLAVFFAFTALQGLPKSAPSNQWNQQQGYGQQQGWNQPHQGYGQQQSYGQQQDWGQPQQSQQHAGGQEYIAGGGATASWGEQSQAGQQGQPASSWDQSSSGQSGWGQQQEQQPQQQPEQEAWGQQPEHQAEQPGWGQQPPAETTGEDQPGEPAVDETQQWTPPDENPPAESQERRDEQPPQQGGWWQQPPP